MAPRLPAGVDPISFFANGAVCWLSGGGAGQKGGKGVSGAQASGAPRPLCPWAHGPWNTRTLTPSSRPCHFPIRLTCPRQSPGWLRHRGASSPADKRALLTAGLTQAPSPQQGDSNRLSQLCHNPTRPSAAMPLDAPSGAPHALAKPPRDSVPSAANSVWKDELSPPTPGTRMENKHTRLNRSVHWTTLGVWKTGSP